MTAALTLMLALALAPTEAPAASPQAVPPDAPPPDTAQQLRTRPIVLELVGLPPEPLRDAIALRLPLRPLVDATAERPERYDYVALTQQDDGRVALTLITADGHAYDRVLEVEADTQARALSSALANLTFAIEVGDVQPDRVDVAPPPPPEPEPEPEPEPLPPPPVVTPQPKPVQAKPVVPPPPNYELGIGVDFGVVAGLAPDTGADALAAGYGRFGLDLRHRKGALGMLGVRLGGRALDGLSLLRTRIDIGGGWAGRWNAFELIVAGAATVEPWSLRRAGARAPLRIGTSDAQRRPLVGGLLRISPGVRLKAGENTWVRLGARLELAGSFVPQDGARTVDIAVAQRSGGRNSTLRAGGLELVAGLELAVWFGLR